MATAVRWLSLLAWLAALLPLAGRHSVQWAQQAGLFEKQADVLLSAAGISRTVIQHPQYYWLLIGLGSFAAGTWLIWLAQKSDQSRHRKSVGRRLVSLARRVDNAQGNFRSRWPENVQHLQFDLRSALLSVYRLGIWVPDHTIFLRRDANMLVSYLNVIGVLLSEGRFSEARSDALRCRDLLMSERANQQVTGSAGREQARPYIRVVSARSG
jgi:hypothetical protein